MPRDVPASLPRSVTPAARDKARRRRLRRMKWAATGLLLLMTALFLATSALGPRWPFIPYVRAFAEAAMVGACADWFAVTALFRRPFGLPIPHTAIIPRNKDRIGDALGRFVVENFLSPRVLDARVRQAELAAWGGAWLQDERNSSMIADRLIGWAPQVLRALPPAAMEELAGSAAAAAAKSVPAAPVASALLAAVWNEGRVQPLVERGADLLADYLAEHETVILEKVQAQSWRWMPAWVDRAIARKITAGLLQLLTDVKQPDHPWRQELIRGVEALIQRLGSDPELLRQGEALKQQVLDDPRFREHAHRLWSEVQQQLHSRWSGDSAEVRGKLAGLVRDFGAWLQHDPALQRTLNTGARTLVRGVLAPRRHEIGRFIGQVVRSWEAGGVVDKLELQFGPDLQFIRVNGALVGGLVGLVLYTVTRLLGWS